MDEAGNLLRLYHGTSSAGNFTLEDINPSYAFLHFDTGGGRQKFIADHPENERAHDERALDEMNFNDGTSVIKSILTSQWKPRDDVRNVKTKSLRHS